ncbi:hypothetical protein FPRO05_10721 [Fusarium proliferatum]|uniref:Uncharacterized protein n=1 Tax=Gibberella intermedia TaxID=948311 RepID=A0A365NCL0_GIBIN|nr:hypothetical protein FPRO05_10721 [Fusarium proliferatum]
MVPSKRPVPSASNTARPKRRGCPANNDVQGSITSDEFAERLSENTRPYQHDTVDEFVGQLVRGPGEGWSEAHENAMNMIWLQSNHSTVMAKMREGKTMQGQLLTLFKVCLRVFKMSPIRFLSFSHGLEYLGERGSSATFSKAFSEVLTRLIVHPAFNGKKETLPTVIQYAVICQIDDRRPWPNTSSTPSCPALAKMVEMMKASETVPSNLSDLMHAVGETVKNSRVKAIPVTEDILEYGGEKVLPVSLYDLRNIAKTLDETIWDDEAWNCTVAEAIDSYLVVLPRQEAPTGEQLPEYYERSHKQKLRDWMVKSGFDPHQQVSDKPDEDMNLHGTDRDVAQDQPQPCDFPSGNGTPGLDVPAVRLFSQATSNPYASLEGQEASSPVRRGSLDRIRDLEREVASLRQEVASFRDMGREIAILKAEVASLKSANPQNEESPAFSQPFSNLTTGLNPESHMDWDAHGKIPF